MTSALVHVTYVGAPSFSSAQLQSDPVLRLDGNGQPKVYGVCGIAVDTIGNLPGEQIVVGALDGHLLVYQRQADGSFGSLLYEAQVAGALGAYNSIVIADLDTTVAGKELYVAGSLGIWKWIP